MARSSQMPGLASAGIVTVNCPGTPCGPLWPSPGGTLFCTAVMPGVEKCSLETSSRSVPVIVTSTVVPCLPPVGNTENSRATGNSASAGATDRAMAAASRRAERRTFHGVAFERMANLMSSDGERAGFRGAENGWRLARPTDPSSAGQHDGSRGLSKTGVSQPRRRPPGKKAPRTSTAPPGGKGASGRCRRLWAQSSQNQGLQALGPTAATCRLTRDSCARRRGSATLATLPPPIPAATIAASPPAGTGRR